MSLENHPNFHAVGFATDIISSYYERLRVHHRKIDESVHDAIRDNIVAFVSVIEDLVDKSQEGK